MKKIQSQNRSLLTIALIVSTMFFLVQCISNSNDEVKETALPSAYINKINYSLFAGSASCATCHKKIYEGHLHTSHNLTSAEASESTIKGSFAKGSNTFTFNDHLYVSMVKADSGFYQNAYQHGEKKVSRRFDIVSGSGTKGQTYLSWKNNQLFQLPISYLTQVHEWANSPGFPDKVIYNRPVTSRCLECHSTYAGVTAAPDNKPEEFNHAQMIYGVQCERCHGPAAQHVAYEKLHPQDTEGRYIVKLALLSRQQNLDLCSLCHSGRLQKTKPSFEFAAGDTLANFFVPDESGPQTNTIDVHGNQMGLLKESKCFINSATLTCNTCHNPHKNERGEEAVFSQRCMECHSKEQHNFCTVKNIPAATLAANCIDCHMPKQPSFSIALLQQGHPQPTAVLIHTHLIKVYK